MTRENNNYGMEEEYRGLLSGAFYGGVPKEDRTGVGTRSVFGRRLRHDMSEGFPLLTGKRVYFKNAVTELLWMLQGRTDMQYLHQHGLKYWDADYERSGRTDGTLGPIYGKQWRNFNGIDQIKKLVCDIKNDPTSRRLMVSAWNPADMEHMALPPCHYGFQVYVNDGKLSLFWSQRSADLFLGLPYDIAMYGLLLVMLAKGADLEPGELGCFLGDCHIYSGHEDAVQTYLERPSFKLPQVSVEQGLRYMPAEGGHVLIPTHGMIHLSEYESGPPITAPLYVG